MLSFMLRFLERYTQELPLGSHFNYTLMSLLEPVNKLRGSGLTMKGMIHNLKEPMENRGLKEENKHSCYH